MGEQTFWVIRKESVLLSQLQACQTVKTSTHLPTLLLLLPVAAAAALLLQALVLLLACLAAVACLQQISVISKHRVDLKYAVSNLKKPTSLQPWQFFRRRTWRGAWHRKQVRSWLRLRLPASPAWPRSCCWSPLVSNSSPGASWGYLICFCPSSVEYFQMISHTFETLQWQNNLLVFIREHFVSDAVRECLHCLMSYLTFKALKFEMLKFKVLKFEIAKTSKTWILASAVCWTKIASLSASWGCNRNDKRCINEG